MNYNDIKKQITHIENMQRKALDNYHKKIKVLDKKLIEIRKSCDHPDNKLYVDIDPAGGPSEMYCGVCGKKLK